jgi:Gametolysin peptidase M11
MQTRALIAGVICAAAFLAPPAAAVTLTGELRTLYVVATWGPVPFSHDELAAAAAETDAFFRASSVGRLSMPGSVAGPILLRRGAFDACDATALRNEAPAATFAGYDRIVFVTPRVDGCAFWGKASGTEVLLNGYLFRNLVAHELGHTIGLAHASRWVCGVLRCSVDEYGGGFSVMGGGGGDFNAFEKSRLGWLTGIVPPTAGGVHELGPVDASTTLPQALVVRTAASEFWFESRSQSTAPFTSLSGASDQPAGMTVLAGPALGVKGGRFTRPNLLLANPVGGPRFAYAAGEAFVRDGVFRVAVEHHSAERAALRFEWLDRVPPAKPPLRVQSRRPGRVGVTWRAAREGASGVESYSVVVDGQVVRTVRPDGPFRRWTEALRVPGGVHRIGVYATDRAGNRGRIASTPIRVR